MQLVEKKVKTSPVRWGFGHKRYHDALRSLGCTDVATPEKVEQWMADKIPHPLRHDAGDVAVMIRPTEFAPVVVKWLAETKCMFEVPGHEPRRLLSHKDREAFRKLKADVPDVDVPDGRGAKAQYVLTPEHLEAAITDWHAGEERDGKWVPLYSLKEIEARMALRTGLQGEHAIKAHWVRDQVSKRFQTAARKPPNA